jgi:NAD+ kinase
MTRVAIIGSPEKDPADTMQRLRRWLADRAEVVFAEFTYDSDEALSERPELLFVLGGDGTLIAAAHNLGQNQLPLVGINLGKLGFLAEFTIDQIEKQGEFLFNGPPPLTRRVMLHVRLERGGGSFHEAPAVNDCVVLAGPPFRMVTLAVKADGDEVAEVRGDGLIVATPSGSTAHNLSAGGPILEPTAEAIILTPICPHTLAFRPLAMGVGHEIVVRLTEANEGTTVTIDGRTCHPFQIGDRVVITRYPADFLLVRNPRHSVWYALRQKLLWGHKPRNGM